MASATTLRLESLILSASELKDKTGWDDTVIREWLNMLRNLVLLAELLDVEINQTIEEVPTDFIDGSIPFVESGFLVEDNVNLFWDSVGGILSAMALSIASDAFIGGDIKGRNRAKQYFFAGF